MRFFISRFSALFLGFSALINCNSQIPLNGLVRAADNGEPLPFAAVINLTSGKACTSNEKGEFIIFPELFPALLQVSSISYSLTEVIVNQADTFIIVFLKPASLSLNEVNVYASHSAIEASSLESLRSSESYNLAGTTKDIFRSVQMLPGVSSNNAASARYNVRGGTYDENLMLINGIEVAEPYHIKVFPMASIGIFNIDLVQRIDFSAGGYSAEYGDALSSVLNVEYRKANNDSVKASISLGMIDLGMVTELPLAKKATLLFAARRSYLDPVVRIVQPEERISIRYYDIQSKFDYEINSRNKISLLAIFSGDRDKVGPEIGRNSYTSSGIFIDKPILIKGTEQNYYLMDAKYNDILLALSGRHIISGKFIINSQFSFYQEKENIPQTEKDSVVYEYSTPELFNRIYFYQSDVQKYEIKTYEYKLTGKIRFNQSNNSKIGIFIKRSEFNYNNTLISSFNKYNNTDTYPDTIKMISFPADIEYNNIHVFKAGAHKIGGFITHLLEVNSKLSVNFGVRADYFSINKDFDFSPRLGISYNILPDVKAFAAWGIFYKSPLMKQLKFSYATPENTKSQKATHYLAGIEKKWFNTSLKIETYYKKYNDIIPLRRTPMSRIIYDVKENQADGFATGIDFQYVLSKHGYHIWFNYSIASAKERLKGTSNYYSRYTDQRHTISSLVMFRIKNNMELGTKLSYGSGYTFQKKFFDSQNYQWINSTEIVTESLPYFLSLDLRFKKEFNIFSYPAQFYVDVINILNRKNSIGHDYRIVDNKPYEENYEFYGVVPTFGVMVDF